jgi:hypothetical protein
MRRLPICERSARKVARKTEFLSQEFIRALQDKCFSYVLATERLHDTRGKRIDPKELVNDPIFRAIHYYREFWLAQITFQENEGDSPGQQPSIEVDPYQTQRLAAQLFQAIGTCDPSILLRIADLMKLNERVRAKYDFLLCAKDVVLPWHYYAGRAALSFSTDGTVPTKNDVKEWAIKLRARASLPAKAGTKALQEIMAAAPKNIPKQWRRIFRELGLADLPQR